jgi:hypothetical protein
MFKQFRFLRILNSFLIEQPAVERDAFLAAVTVRRSITAIFWITGIFQEE